MSNLEKVLEQIGQAIKNKDYSEAQRLALGVVRRFPLYEEAWVLLGDSLFYEGQGLMAKKVYTRGALFNPNASWIQKKFEQLKNAPHGESKKEIEDLFIFPLVAKVTAALIVKNGERSIGRCLAALVDAVDEILVVDTGSTDRTVDIATSIPKTRVVHFPWNDDFSSARNFGIEQLKTGWVLWVDADEYLFPEDIEKVKYTATLLDSYQPHPLLYVELIDQIGDQITVHFVPRLFPLRGQLKYHGRIHEQLGAIHGNRYTESNTHDFLVQIRLQHDGYDPNKVDMERKYHRNIQLLQKMAEEEPDDPTWWLYLGRELLGINDLDQGIKALIQAEVKGMATEGFGSLLEVQRLLVIGLINRKNIAEAEKVCYRMIKTDPRFPDSYYYLANVLIQKGSGFFKEVELNLRKSKELFSAYQGLVTANQEILEWKADLLNADLRRLAGKINEARSLYTRVFEVCPIAYKEIIKNVLNKL
jgi:glycosyltransferase involved in cell wall biosynthesis